jgi:peptidoglycan/xylan/chitin deacetylase (PgdA/CDA1 family)
MQAAGSLAIGLSCVLLLGGVTACRGDKDPTSLRAPLPAPQVSLIAQEKEVWAPLSPDRSAIPVLLYHGIGPESDFSNAADAAYGVDSESFAKQMTMIKNAGYQTVSLTTFLDFVNHRPAELPPRPLLLTFDDGRADSWTGSDGILRELGFNAVMFLDVGSVDRGGPEYLTWPEINTMQASGGWEMQLHSGKGHHQIHYGEGPDDYGAFYAYRDLGENFSAWKQRVRSDIDWGQQTRHKRLGVSTDVVRSALRKLRPAGHQRPAHPGRPPGLAECTLRRRLHSGRERASRTGQPAATRPYPGGPCDQRWLDQRNAALRRKRGKVSTGRLPTGTHTTPPLPVGGASRPAPTAGRHERGRGSTLLPADGRMDLVRESRTTPRPS